jgi:hypothetical protein
MTSGNGNGEETNKNYYHHLSSEIQEEKKISRNRKILKLRKFSVSFKISRKIQK